MSRIFAYANLETGNIEQVIDIGLHATNIEDGQVENGYILLDVTERNDLHLMHTERAYKNGSWIIRPPRPTVYYTWSNDLEEWIFDTERFLFDIRVERDKLLKASDWTQMPDSPLSAASKESWAVYRQQLRDFPATITTETTLEELVWPESP